MYYVKYNSTCSISIYGTLYLRYLWFFRRESQAHSQMERSPAQFQGLRDSNPRLRPRIDQKCRRNVSRATNDHQRQEEDRADQQEIAKTNESHHEQTNVATRIRRHEPPHWIPTSRRASRHVLIYDILCDLFVTYSIVVYCSLL